MTDDFYGLYSAFFNFNSRPDLCPDNEVHEKPKSVEDGEIGVLEKAYGSLRGKTINVELATLLELLPRKRKRIDAYKSLIKILKIDKDCTLVIKSRKTRE